MMEIHGWSPLVAIGKYLSMLADGYLIADLYNEASDPTTGFFPKT